VDEIDLIDKDSIILQYIKCRKNMFAITLWKPGMSALSNLVTQLEREGEVYYIKTINLTKNGLRNLMFCYYDDFTNEAAFTFIEKKLQYIDAINDNNPVCLILFDNTQNKRLSGQGSPYKKYLRDLVMTHISVDKEKYRGNDIMHINDYFYQTIEYSQMILNENSISLLNTQICKNYLMTGFETANLKMQTLRSVLYSNLSLLEIDRFIAMGGTVFYAEGIRTFNDIDAIFIDNEPNNSTNLVMFVDKYFSNKSTKFYFLDAAIQGSTLWNTSWADKDKKILEFLKIDTYKNLVLDPRNFFYFQGIKLVTFEYEMIRKLIRNRTEDHVDFMMINILYPEIIQDYVKVQSDPPFFIIADKYKQIAGQFDDRYPEIKLKILNRRYTKEQIDDAKKSHLAGLFEKFFSKK
jgi:hypothetical protein